MDQNEAANKLWAGRFEKDITNSVLEYTHTVDIDKRLLESELWGSTAHVLMLSRQNILKKDVAKKIINAIIELRELSNDGVFILDKKLEDVHLNVESYLIDKLGKEIGGQVHTARSRNDQVVTDTRLYLRESLLSIQLEIIKLIFVLLGLADQHTKTVIVGYTHGQPAQPISYGFWLSSYASIFLRDIERLEKAYETTNQNPLGACALAGTSFPIDRQFTTDLLGFDGLILHSLDATSTRDFILETLSSFAILMSNFSKMAEEIIIWSSFEYGVLQVDDAFATGSSIMPQKKNPVVAELIRSRTGRVYGSLMQLLTSTKGIPMGYNCDLQEDKPPLWNSIDTVMSTVSMLREHIETMQINPERFLALSWINFTTATELANYFVQELNMSFREAHRIVGSIVKRLSNDGYNLSHINNISELLKVEKIELNPEKLSEILNPERSIEKQNSEGGTSPSRTMDIIKQLREELADHETILKRRRLRIQGAYSKTNELAKGLL